MNIVLCTTDPNYSFSTEKRERKENVQLDSSLSRCSLKLNTNPGQLRRLREREKGLRWNYIDTNGYDYATRQTQKKMWEKLTTKGVTQKNYRKKSKFYEGKTKPL